MHRLLLGAIFGLIAPFAMAETVVDPHAGHQMPDQQVTGTETPSTLAYMQANQAMHGAMAIEFTGDADVDFIRGMIPHHQGAVEMAKIVLQHGKDPEVRNLAEGVIAAQEAEIAWMTDWLAKNGH